MKCNRCGLTNQVSARFCNNCGAPLNTGSPQPPLQQAQKSNANKWILGIILAAILGGCVLTGLVSILSGVSPVSTQPLLEKENSSPSAPPPDKKSPEFTKPPETAWNYSYHQDEMAGQSMKSAIVQSSNTVDFAFPYGGSQRASLELRRRRGRDEVMLSLEKGQLTCGGYNNRGVSVRFDDKPARRFSVSESADHSSTIVFINNEKSFVAEAKKAKKILIEAIVYQNGAPVFEFNTAGLEWER